MGASQSSPTHVTHDYNITPPKRGLHVLRVAPYSPAAQTDLEPFFDFVVGLDAESNTEGDEVDDLADVVAKHEGRPLGLVIWSSKSRTVRLTQIIPSREWSSVAGAASTSTNAPPLLGLTMRACNPSHSLEAVWHVLDVADDSPAESAGLVPRGDWVVGWSGGPLAKEQDFYDVVESHEGKPLRIFIYSYDFDTLREVVVVPNRQWGGAGLLGCELGYGLLHRIPEAPSTLFSAKDLGDVEEDMYSSSSGYYGREPPSRTDSETVFVPADAYSYDSVEVEAALRSAGFSSGYGNADGQDAVYAPYAKAFDEHNLPSGYPAVHDLSNGSSHSAFSEMQDGHPVIDVSESVSAVVDHGPIPPSTQLGTTLQSFRNIAEPSGPTGVALRVQTDDLEPVEPGTLTAVALRSTVVPRAPPPSALDPAPYTPSRPVPYNGRQASLETTSEEDDDEPPKSADTLIAASQLPAIAMPTPKPLAQATTPTRAESGTNTPRPVSGSSTPTGVSQREPSPPTLGRGPFGPMGMNRAGMGFRMSSGSSFGQPAGTPPRWAASPTAPLMDRTDLESVDGDTETEDGEDTETENEDGLE